jgi:hypothetical protein
MEREQPGAASPHTLCDRLLHPDERFYVEGDSEHILWAPKDVTRLAALLYEAKQADLRWSLDELDQERAFLRLSLRALSQIENIDVPSRVCAVQPGCRLADLESALLESGLELAWTAWPWMDEALRLGDILCQRMQNGTYVAQRSPFSRLLGFDCLGPDGSLYSFGTRLPGGMLGPLPTSKTLYEGQRLFPIRLYLELTPRPRERNSLLLSFAKASLAEDAWSSLLAHEARFERLDWIGSSSKHFILQQSTVEPLSCPFGAECADGMVLSRLQRFLREAACPGILDAQPSINLPGYFWYHYKEGRGWIWKE